MSPDNSYAFRCRQCHKLLAMNIVGSFEIKCVRCGSLNTAMEKMAEQVIVTNRQGIIMFVNSEVEKVTGYTIDEVIGKKPSLWGGQMPQAFYEKMWKNLLEDKKSVLVKVTNRHKSGYLYDALLQISPVLNTVGTVEFFIGFESVINKHVG